MTSVLIDNILPRTQATATGGQTVYNTNWTANAASDVVVYSRAEGVDADDATQQLNSSQYSVAFIGDQAIVQVTLVTPSTLGDIVTIIRNTPADRENLYSNTNFTPSMLNNDFGILTLVDQQAELVNQEIGPRYNYSAVINPSLSFPTEDTILPVLGPNQVWMKNAAGTAIIAEDFTPGGGGSGTVTSVDTGLGLTGGPIVTFGTISFAPIPANTFWGNVTNATNLPGTIATSYFLISSNNLSDVPNKATARSNLGLAIGTNVEAWSPALDSIAALSTGANNMIYTTASNTYAVISSGASSVLITSAGSVPSFSQTLPSAVQSNITHLGAQSAALDMNSHLINNVTDPVSAQDAATKAYVDSAGGAFLPLAGGTMSGVIDMGNHKIINITDPTSSKDAVNLEYLNSQLAFYLTLSGGTMTGLINMGSNKITALATPTVSTDAANKAYVDSVAAGFIVKPAVYASSTTALTVTYSNGAAGIGATLTNAGTQATFTIDGTTPAVNSRILIKDQSSTFQNGIYTVTDVGSIITNWVLTRATDYDQPSEIQPGDLVIVNNGTVNGGASFVETASVTAIGTDPILFSQFTFSASSVLLKANNLSDVADKTTSFNNISPLTTKGDLIGYSTQNVRLAVGITNGQILQVSSGAATGLAWSTATYPTTTTANQILYSSATNVVGGISTLAGGVLVTDNTSVPQFLTNPGVAGKVLQSANAAIPSWSTPTYPSASGSAGKILRSDGTNNVYSTSTFADTYTASNLLYSNGSNTVTGLATANSAVLVTNSSGVPAWSSTMTNGQVIIGATSGTPAAATLTAGTGINITNGSGSITINATGSGMSTVEVTGTSATMAINTAYIASNASLVTLTMPSTFALGDTISVIGKGAGGWKIVYGSGQSLQVGSSTTTTTTGSVASTNRYDSINLMGTTANTTMTTLGAVQGILTVV